MLKRLSSAISTAHAISLAIREAPDAIRECVEFARENGSTTEEVEFWKAARDRWMDWACHIEGGQDTPGMPLTTDGDTHMMARITAALNVGNKAIFELESWRSWARDITAKTGKCHELRMSVEDFFDRMADNVNNTRSDLDLVEYIANEVWLWAKERITQLQVDVDSLGGALLAEHKIAMDYATQITEARELLSGLSSGLGYGLGGDDESLPSMIGRVRDGITENLKVMTELRDTAQRERVYLQSDVDSLKAALGAECNVAIGFSQQVDALKAKLTETERALAEMNGMYDDQCKATVVARENTETLAAIALKERDEFKARVENQASEIAALRNRVTELVCERTDIKSKLSTVTSEANELARAIEAERREYQAKLARYEEAERWHQVTAGEGELPPPIPVLWEPNDQENHPSVNYPRVSIPGNSGTYRWRYLSSEDVSQ